MIRVKKRLSLWTLILSICYCNVSFVSATENKWEAKTREIKIDGTTYQINYVQADLSDPKVRLGGILANDRIATAAKMDAMAEENALVLLLLQRRYTEAITREEACQLAVCLYQRLGGEPLDLSSQVKGSFFDQAVQLKLQRGLAWDPTESTVICQRQEVIQLLAAVMDHFLPATREYAALISVDQSEVASWARDAIERLVACEIVQGVDFVYLAPRAITTREMAVLFSNRIYEYCRRVG